MEYFRSHNDWYICVVTEDVPFLGVVIFLTAVNTAGTQEKKDRGMSMLK